ncbi:OHCU decarboxylase [Pokkaliibacter plantistimulans]|uniref:2-oxo-4-hydroxy-4-carboxy-5-ureidoimidazoline decarboxylase n=1 Tax=Proteobacteria bacterium 228 TaxID=2083153 RepID=A0A2S5KVJ9_9PROT|nr:2-oxo-4-hydroxy-4-carboxy-5-ureidoimidazoline decarboxylase [Pokkaliibacter plantistimulans]PPC78790.1 OHCU decarboxylase [Pokkaliibacter plantistimulans]
MFTNYLNTYSPDDLRRHLRNSCSAERWVELVADGSPFSSEPFFVATVRNAFAALSSDDWLEAFAGHPMIGDVNSLREKYADTRGLAASEQSAVAAAQEEVLQQLAAGNQAYLDKHGFIFIVFATGKSAEEMLALLNDRLPNSTEEEIVNAAREQRKITALRLSKWLRTAWLAEELA